MSSFSSREPYLREDHFSGGRPEPTTTVEVAGRILGLFRNKAYESAAAPFLPRPGSSSSPPSAGMNGRRSPPSGSRLQAKALLDWLRGHADDRGEVSFSDALQRGPGVLRTKAPLEAAFKVLADHGWTGEVSARPRRIRVWSGSGEGER